MGSGGRAVKHQTVSRGDGGSIPPAAVSKLRQFHSPHICLCLSEETLKVGGPFYLVSMPGEVKGPTQGGKLMTVMVSKLTGGHLMEEEDVDSGVASRITHIHLSDMLHTNDLGLVTLMCFSVFCS